MKKTILIFLSLLVLAFLASCPEEDNGGGGEKKEIDPLLVGDYFFPEDVKELADDKFYINGAKGDGFFYNFTKTTFSTCSSSYIYVNRKFVPDTSIHAYTKDGILYSYEDDSVIFNYSVLPKTRITNYVACGIRDENTVLFVLTPENEKLIFVKLPASSFE
jgi:hypothetical protein